MPKLGALKKVPKYEAWAIIRIYLDVQQTLYLASKYILPSWI